jgi:hypothetical protein
MDSSDTVEMLPLYPLCVNPPCKIPGLDGWIDLHPRICGLGTSPKRWYNRYMTIDKDKILKRQSEISELLQAFCSAKLNDEYLELAEKLLAKMSRKRNVPFETGKVEIWAAAIIHALGSINFLFDPAQKPHVMAQEIHDFFNASTSSVSNKAKQIRDMFKLRQWDDEFGTHEMKANNPFDRFVMLNNGMIALRED